MKGKSPPDTKDLGMTSGADWADTDNSEIERAEDSVVEGANDSDREGADDSEVEMQTTRTQSVQMIRMKT